MKLPIERSDLKAYAQSLLSRFPPATGIHLPMTVETDATSRSMDGLETCMLFHQKSVDHFLPGFKVNSLLLGSPGSGKSFALKSYCRQWAIDLLEQDDQSVCWNNEPSRIPIHIDLKRYTGSIDRWLQPLNEAIKLTSLVKNKQVVFLVDSFNEAPRKYLEDGTLAEKLATWMGNTPECHWLIASRTAEGLDFFPGEHFRMAGMQPEFVKWQLDRLGVQVGGAHAESLIRLLCKPIFLSALIAGRLQLDPGGTHPAAAVECLIQSYLQELRIELRFDPRVIAALGPLAENAVHVGEELFSKADMVEAIQQKLPTHCRQGVAEKIADRLLGAGLLLDYGHGQFAFYHQSITELIACKHVAGKVAINLDYFDELLSTTRWDEAIQFMTYYLNADDTERLFI